MPFRNPLTGSYQILNESFLLERSKRDDDPRKAFYRALLSSKNCENYYKSVGSLVVKPTTYRKKINADMEIKYVLKRGWITLENNQQVNCDFSPEEVLDPEKYFEGSTKKISVNIYERNFLARKKCIAYHGLSCSVCKFNFESKWGEIGQGFIHVHHLKPLAAINEKYELNPVADLRPVCPNCHAMLHRKSPPYSIEELIELMVS